MYLTRYLQASRPLTYMGRDLRPGDAFVATDADAEYLVRHGRAAEHVDAPMRATEVPDRPAEPPVRPVEPPASHVEDADDEGETDETDDGAVDPVMTTSTSMPRRRGRPRRSDAT